MVSGLLAPQLQRLTDGALTLPVIPGRITGAHFELGEALSARAQLG